MKRFKLTLEYDGTVFKGWQRQPDQKTVQQCLDDAASILAGSPVASQAAGRTDAGVHATGQVAHIDLPNKFSEFEVLMALNSIMRPAPVVVVKSEEMDESFHARFGATRRYYRYDIHNRRPRLALNTLRAWHVSRMLDIEKMQKGADFLLGTHDFTSFRDTECQSKSPVKTLDYISIEQQGEHIQTLIHARSFLHHQVRIIMGSLVLVGRNKWQPEDIANALNAKSRAAAGPTAPAHGLYFTRVDYD